MYRRFHGFRFWSALALGIYAVGAVAAPLVHIFCVHSHASITEAQQVDPDRFRDPVSGHVDLTRLAEAVGIAGAHDESKPHTHSTGGEPGNPASHGANSIEHFGLAELAAAPFPIFAVVPAPRILAATEKTLEGPPIELRHLSAQRAQAPPVG